MLDWSDAAQAQLEGGAITPIILVRVDTHPVMRLWFGIGEFDQAPPDTIEDAAGAVYIGMGALVDIDELELFLNGQASRINLTLAGKTVTSQVLAAVFTDLDVTEGAEVNIGLMILGQDLQPMSPVAWLWSGIGSSLTANVDLSSGGISSITFPVGSLFTGRTQPAEERWTDASQEARSPGDRGLEHIADINAGTTKQWPTP